MHLCRLLATPPLSSLLFSSQDPSHCWASASSQPLRVCAWETWGEGASGARGASTQFCMIGKALNVQCCISATGSSREAAICAMCLYLRRLVLQGSTCSISPLNLHINVAGIWQEIGDDFVSFWMVTDVSSSETNLIYGLRYNQCALFLWGVNSSGITCKSSLKWHAITAAIMLKGDKLP